jgi:hypothetical protein
MTVSNESDLYRALGRIEGGVESTRQEVTTLRTEQTTRLDNHASRIAALEHWRTRTTAYFAGIGAALTAVAGTIGYLLSLLK